MVGRLPIQDAAHTANDSTQLVLRLTITLLYSRLRLLLRLATRASEPATRKSGLAPIPRFLKPCRKPSRVRTADRHTSGSRQRPALEAAVYLQLMITWYNFKSKHIIDWRRSHLELDSHHATLVAIEFTRATSQSTSPPSERQVPVDSSARPTTLITIVSLIYSNHATPFTSIMRE